MSEASVDRPLQHDSARPPRWLGRGLFMAGLAVFLGLFAWYALGALQGLGVNVLIAFFVALALEPMVLFLVRHGWRRGLAAGVTIVGSVLVLAVVLALFGKVFVEQLVQLFGTLPDIYANLQDSVSARFDVALPDSDDLIRQGLSAWGDDVASGVIFVGSSLLSGLFSFTTILLVAFYLIAAGPRFRASICAWLTPNRQSEMLHLWEVTQVKVSDFITSRIVLAALSSVFTCIFLLVIGTPYPVPLALFTGVVSQFVPTIGTYIGGALPVVVALTSQGVAQAIGVTIFIVAYQQVENFFFSPKVSAQALQMNPAVSFLVVLAFGAVFGPVGAFLGLPVAATIQAVGNTYFQRHEIIDSAMLHDPQGRDPRQPREPRQPRSGRRGPRSAG